MNLASIAADGKVWMKQEAPTYASVGAVHELESMTWQAVIEQATVSSPPLQTRLAVGKNESACGTHK